MSPHRTPQVLSFLLHPCKPCIIKELHTLLRNGNRLSPAISAGSALFLSQRGWGGIPSGRGRCQEPRGRSAAEVNAMLRPPSTPSRSVRRNGRPSDVPQRLEDPATRGVVQRLIIAHLKQIGHSAEPLLTGKHPRLRQSALAALAHQWRRHAP